MDQQPQQKRRRNRAALSCIECRRRKIKCDRKRPCSNCTATKVCCQFGPAIPSGVPDRDASPSSAPLPELPHTPSILEIPPAQEVIRQHVSNSLQTPESTPRHVAQSQAPGLLAVHQSILKRQLGDKIVMNKTKTLRCSHWMYFADQLIHAREMCASAAHDYTPVKLPTNSGLENCLAETTTIFRQCKSMSKALKSTRPFRSLLPVNIAALSFPDQAISDQMIAQYLRLFEGTYRILHIPTFRSLYERYKADPQQASIETRLLILLVIALGYSLQEDLGSETREQIHRWVFSAKVWLTGPMEKDRLTITGLQIHCLTLLACQMFPIGGDISWMSVSSLVQRAIQMGLHRDPSHLPPMSNLQAELRRRLWATSLELLVQSCLDAAVPPCLSSTAFDTLPPSNVNDEDLTDSASAQIPLPTETFTDSTIQRLLQRSLSTRLRVLHLMNGLGSELAYGDVLKLSEELHSAIHLIHISLQSPRSTAFQRNLADFLVRRFLIPIHCPFAMEAHKNPLFNHSLRECIDSAVSILYPEPDSHFSRLFVFANGIFREANRHAISAASLQLLTETQAQQQDHTLRRIPYRTNHFLKIVEDLRDLSVHRLRHTESNVKMHMFLSMVLAQAEAMTAGKPVLPAMVQAARDSAQSSHDILKLHRAQTPFVSQELSLWTVDHDNSDGLENGLYDFVSSNMLFDL